MIYTVENTMAAGRPVKLVKDAHGTVYDKTIMIDTDKGIIVKAVTNAEGQIQMDWDKGEMATLTLTNVPLPITVEFYGERPSG